ncbi:hypothetical protein BDW74DRAFT_149667 [Aspergillus multicolor]|uniref:uncharacterized protein n=1 Tax=Aspergillus multicolor TaxID=41759 RepID=UPI003CCD4F7B
MKFVCSYLKHHGKYGSFLQAWLGWDAGFESEPCIVRRFHNPGQVIEYRPEAWSYLKEQPTPRGEQRARSGAQSAIQPSPPSVTRKRVADSGATSTSHTKRRQLDERDISPSGSEVSDSSLSSLSDEGGSEDSEVSEDDDEKDASTDTRTGPHQNSANDRPLVNADNEPRSGIENNKPPPTPSQGPELFSS